MLSLQCKSLVLEIVVGVQRPSQSIFLFARGALGSLHVERSSIDRPCSDNELLQEPGEKALHVLERLRSSDGTVVEKQYRIETAGVIQNVQIVDTTGAGDAYVGGYLSALKFAEAPSVILALNFGAWVAGKKLDGPGAQSALPSGSQQVDEQLGRSSQEVQRSLERTLRQFGETKVPSTSR